MASAGSFTSLDGACGSSACAEDVARRDVLTCPTTTSIAEAAAMMATMGCGSIVVIEAGKAVGIWTERDAATLDMSRPDCFDRPIHTVMSINLKTVAPDCPLSEAGARLKQEGIRHLVMIDADGHPVGMLSQTDVVLNHGVEHYLTFKDVHSASTRPALLLDAATTVRAAARRLATERQDAAIVVGEDEPGIITERDMVRAVAERDADGTVGRRASRPLISVPPDAPLLTARNLFIQQGIRHLAVRESDGRFVGLISFSEMLSILQQEYTAQLNAALRERDEALIRSRKDLLLARQVIEASLEGVIIASDDGLIEYVNPAFTQLTGYAAAEALGRNPRFLQSGRQSPEFYARMWESLQTTGSWQGEIWNCRKSGEMFAAWLSINAIRDADGRIGKFAAIFTDITQRKEHEEKVLRLAYFDPLTGLPNRRLLSDRLSQALAKARRARLSLAVMFLDLDLFKRINDTLGHDIGDGVLVEVANRLQHCVREGDTVARLGGDEFTVLLPELSEPTDAVILAERIIAAIRQPLLLAGHRLSVTTSVGIALYPNDGDSADELLKSADSAMYRAKSCGRNSYYMASLGVVDRFERLACLRRDLPRALAQQQFHLAYQVKVDMTTGRIRGAEALARWQHPEMGVVSPGEFIPLAERQGLMPQLGEWALRTACRQNRRWQDQGLPPIRMAVNVSRHQLRDAGFGDLVERILDDAGLAPQWLELELTEEALGEDPKAMKRLLDRLRGLGVGVSIDDFGTHHSSITALQRLPVDMLKIDRSLIASLRLAFQDKDLVAAIVGVCHALGMRAVAEGVETPEQVAFLREVGCDEIQGYLISRTVSAADLETMFDRSLLPV